MIPTSNTVDTERKHQTCATEDATTALVVTTTKSTPNKVASATLLITRKLTASKPKSKEGKKPEATESEVQKTTEEFKRRENHISQPKSRIQLAFCSRIMQ